MHLDASQVDPESVPTSLPLNALLTPGGHHQEQCACPGHALCNLTKIQAML